MAYLNGLIPLSVEALRVNWATLLVQDVCVKETLPFQGNPRAGGVGEYFDVSRRKGLCGYKFIIIEVSISA
jgi:hypothetical protein